ncbi:hypothetical protein [Oceanobacter sp. 3_MG-2023]|uniref:hypothetical protein n=1 Tax=Oceanobacter sp. 3_MG-2023 TaxID=3062622 RepID=UPI002732F60C|nr:hypothetical protein [Oceanobacter sp. 3_MG-2023]MDP2505401.1 hypothetical protein [Oceanobacter sp. 3_MG-2023]
MKPMIDTRAAARERLVAIERKLPLPVVVSGQLVVGIDPDLVQSGVAEVRGGELLSLNKRSFPDLLEYAVGLDTEHVLFVVEDVETDKTTYHRAKTNARQHARIAQNVGQVKGVARVLVECLQHRGFRVVQVAPLKGPAKRQAKTDAVFFNRLTGWSGRSNSDTRDAALLALYGVPKDKAISA